ncbi:MAG: hypothetical protein KatS3mg044_1353 [Rhodothermaceae bacterium]|nr:MAG: hypothetical protein KatS3mg044_1353 [Rhodothermaceae bacterium]
MRAASIALTGLVLVLIGLPARAQVGVQVLHGEDLYAAGVLRPADLLRLVDGVSTYSLDEYTPYLSVGGLAPFQSGAWAVLIDGQPLDASALGHVPLNALPVPLSAIDSVTVHQRPVVLGGRVYAGGVLHLHTRRPRAGLHVEATTGAGNEIGDPGPYIFSAYATPNIDRTGPAARAGLSYARNGTYLRIDFFTDEHHASDERIVERIRLLYTDRNNPRLMLDGATVTAGLDGAAGRFRLFGGYSRFRDFRFFEPLGQEIPTTQDLYSAGFDGDTAPGRPTAWVYRLAVTAVHLGPRPDSDPVSFGWRQVQASLHAGRRFEAGRYRLEAGWAATYQRVAATPDPSDPDVLVPRLYFRGSTRLGARWTQRAALFAGLHTGRPGHPDRLGFQFLAETTYRPAPAHRLVLALAALRQGAEETAPRWYWIRQGYAFLAQQGVDVPLPSRLNDPRTFTADLSWHSDLRTGLTAEITTGIRHFRGMTLAQYHVIPDTAALITTTEITTRGGGTVLTARARAGWRPLPFLEATLAYTLTHPVDHGDEAFRAAWEGLARHTAGLTMHLVPHPRLRFFGRARVTSSTTWHSFALVDASGAGAPAHRPAYLLLDAGVEKRLWYDHLRLHVALRYLTNTAYRPHPAGAVTNLTVFTQLNARF